MQVIGRLAPGASLSGSAGIAHLLGSNGISETNRRNRVGLSYSMTAGGNSIVATQGGRFLAVFSIVTALTLAIVCANVANLMLGRAVLRQRELALRQTLGASRGRILRTLVAEGVIIAIAAWLAASVFALAVSKGVIHFFPPNDQGATLLLDLTPDWRVIVYAFALAMAGTLAFTIGPAVRAWRQELLPSLRSGELGVVAGRSTLSSALVVVQLGFAVLLLTSAGLAYRSLHMLGSIDTGFKKENLVLANVEISEAAVTKEMQIALLDRLSERLRAVPGIQSVSYLRPDWRPTAVWTDASQQAVMATALSVGPDYFAVLGMTPLDGREFSSREARRTGQEVLITQHLAESLWPGESPVGRTFQLGARREPVEVVGEVPNGVFSRFQRETRASYVFQPVQPGPLPRGDVTITFYVRHTGALDSIASAIGRAVREVDARMPVTYLRTMEAELGDFASLVRIITIWMMLFAIGSLAIAVIGQHGRRLRHAAAYARLRRPHRPRRFVPADSRLRHRSGLRWTGVGLAIGFGLSLAAGTAFRKSAGRCHADRRTDVSGRVHLY